MIAELSLVVKLDGSQELAKTNTGNCRSGNVHFKPMVIDGW